MVSTEVKEKVKKKLSLGKNIDPEVKKDFEQNRKDLSVNIKLQDGKLIANYNCRYDNEWKDFTKVHNDFKDFNDYATKFFAINEE